ncbi:hypothetical protein LSCM1_04145 [Leishmania martiniquensis]|uniref:Uncharacterized protein n=1 Tax=Leishmania martiniquensis TaxID=1580590 RepID=A0A836HGJ5_9TRYP|nr:hypothetical protein LSCM1_04145 [Leishmania martiniquensis]
MKLSPVVLHVSCYPRIHGCRAAAGGVADVLRRCARPVAPAQASRVLFGLGMRPPSEVSGEHLTSSSALIVQWQQRRQVCSEAPASALRSQMMMTSEAVADERLSNSHLAASPGSPTTPTLFPSNASTPGSTADALEASLVAQLQRLAKEHQVKSKSRSGEVVVDSGGTAADMPVASAASACGTADLVSRVNVVPDKNRDDTTVAPAHDDKPAWQRGLQLVQTTSCATVAVMEWLLFVCVRSSQATTEATGLPAKAPLEVCEGVYNAWRALHRAQMPESDAEATTTGEVKATAPSRTAHRLPASSPLALGSPSPSQVHLSRHRSPFSPKGIHHHYATHLLREFHSSQTAAASCKAMRKDSSGSHGYGGNYKAPGTTKSSDAAWAASMHRAHYLLHRVLEVLLVHLPQDEVAAAGTLAAKVGEETYDAEGARSRKSGTGQPPLRPTTALLVLEAARHVARLRRQSSMLSNIGSSPNFALLSCLWETAHDCGLPQNAPVASSSRAHSALAVVAREAFEAIMRSSATAEMRTPTGASPQEQHRRLQDIALVLYMGFLATICALPMPESCLEPELQSIECFVLAGSSTARQLSSASQQQQTLHRLPPRSLVSDDQATDGDEGPVSAAAAVAVAAGVRWLLATYLSPLSPPLETTPEPRAEARRRQREFVRDAVMAALCRPRKQLTSSSQEPPSAAPAHNQDADVAPSRAPAFALPWCAWMLRVLIHDDALQRQKHESGTASLEDVPRSGTGEMSTLALASRLVMELRRHSQATLVCDRSSWFKDHRQHRHAKLGRRLQQIVWAVLLDAAVRGQLGIADSCSAPAKNSLATPHCAQAGPHPHRGVPAVLQRLCRPHYDKTQWRHPSVNLYMRLLDQWGESAQVRQVFATVARREREWQLEVQKAVLEERRVLVTLGEEAGGDGKDSVASAGGSGVGESGAAEARVARAFRRYRPALHLRSCLITLRHCGCPTRALAVLWEESTDAGDVNVGDSGAPVTVAQAKLAGEVLQYMICSLHVSERRLRAPSADDGPEASQARKTIEVDGLPLTRWVAWMHRSCVPALARLYQSAGLEEEWEQLRLGRAYTTETERAMRA